MKKYFCILLVNILLVSGCEQNNGKIVKIKGTNTIGSITFDDTLSGEVEVVYKDIFGNLNKIRLSSKQVEIVDNTKEKE